MDQVGILDLVAIGLVDRVPLARIAVLLLGDLGQAVAAHDRIGPAGRRAHAPGLGRGRRGGRASALNVREIRLLGRLIVTEDLVEQSHCPPPSKDWPGRTPGPENSVLWGIRHVRAVIWVTRRWPGRPLVDRFEAGHDLGPA